MADKPAKKRAPRKTGHPPAKNPGGRPAGKNIANPAMLEKIARMWLQGWTVNAIAAACGLNWHTVDRHLKGTIRAAWKDHCAVNLIDDLALVKHLQWLAFQEFEKSQQPETRETIEKALLDGNADPQLVKHVVSTLDRQRHLPLYRQMGGRIPGQGWPLLRGRNGRRRRRAASAADQRQDARRGGTDDGRAAAEAKHLGA
jgi:hypothetical protein